MKARKKRRRGLAARVARKAAKGLGYALLVLVGLIALLLACVNLPPLRAFVAARANGILAEQFAGKLVIERIGAIGWGGVSGVDARVYDPAGKQVLDVHGLEVSLPWPRLVWDLVVAKPDPLTIRIDRIALEHVDAALRDDGSGAPTLARTFQPRKPSTEPPSEKETVLAIEAIDVEHAWIHGALGSSPPLDVELAGLAANLRLAESATTFAVERLKLEARGLPRRVDPRGELTAKAHIGKAPGDRRAQARFRGRVAGVSLLVEGELADRKVNALVHAVAPPDAVTDLAPSIIPRGSTELALKAGGTLPDVTFEARVLTLGGRFQARGGAHVEPPLSAHLRVEGEQLDASAFVPTAPESDVAFELTAEAAMIGRRLDGSYRLALAPSRLEQQALPGLDTNGRVTRDPDGALRIDGLAELHEAGAPTQVDYSVELGERSWLEARSETRLTRPPRLVELAGVSVAGVMEARVRYDLEAGTVAARVNAALPRVVQKRNEISHLRVLAAATGSVQALAFELQANAEDVIGAGRRFQDVMVRGSGSTRGARVEASLTGSEGERLSAVTHVALQPVPSFERSELVVTRERTTLRARIAEVTLGEQLRVDGLELEGVGRARASLVMGQRLERLDAATESLDVPRLARVLGVKPPLKAGKLSVEARLERRQGEPRGYLRGQAGELGFGVVEDGRVVLDLAVEQGRTSGTVQANLRGGGHGVVTVEDVPLLEPPLTPDKLELLTGKLTVRGDLDLRSLEPLIEGGVLPLEKAQGKVELDVALERREEGERLPDLDLRVATRGLELVGKRKPVAREPNVAQAREAAPWYVRELDVAAELRLEGASGKTALNVAARDDQGDLLRVDARTELPRTVSDALNPPLQDLPIEARLSVPTRSLEALPEMIPFQGSEGHATVEVEVRGTPRNPRVELHGRLDRLRPLDADVEPLDVVYRGWLALDGGQFSLDAYASGGRVARVRGAWQGDIRRLGQADQEQSPVRGRGAIVLERLPLAAVPGAEVRQLKGLLSGRITVEDFGREPRVDARLEARPLTLGQASFESLLATVRLENRQLEAVTRLRQKDGRAEARLSGRYDWGARLAPRLEMPLDTRVKAERLRLAGLAVLAPGAINEVDGRLDADLDGRFGGERPELHGSLRLTDGVLQEPTIGQRFQDIDASVKLVPGEARLEKLTARGTAGRLTMTAAARLNGLGLRDADAHLRIEKDEKIPITLQGVDVGDAYGKLDATVRVDERSGTQVRVEVPELTIELPESGGPGVQELEPAEFVRIGARQQAGDFVTLPLQPLEEEKAPGEPGPPTVVIVKLGPRATIKKGTAVDVQLGGETRIELAEKALVTGQLRLSSGKLDLRGKLFDIERGVITFDGSDPANPTVLVTARWDSPADYTVYVEYAGTAQQGQLTLSSEPALTQDQILSLLLFGNPDGNMGGGSGDPTAAAFGVAGGTAVRGLNRVLDKVTKIDVDARVDTSTGSARPELVIQLTPRLSARLTRALGEPAPGQAPDRTFATLDLRLTGRWSLATQVGDRGASALDLIWRHRY